jgi:hypothetical protein
MAGSREGRFLPRVTLGSRRAFHLADAELKFSMAGSCGRRILPRAPLGSRRASRPVDGGLEFSMECLLRRAGPDFPMAGFCGAGFRCSPQLESPENCFRRTTGSLENRSNIPQEQKFLWKT